MRKCDEVSGVEGLEYASNESVHDVSDFNDSERAWVAFFRNKA